MGMKTTIKTEVVDSAKLAQFRTLITSFMCDSSTNSKTYAELVAIFEKCQPKFTSKNDPSNDLRILRFQDDMQNGTWAGDVVITVDIYLNIVTDGIHRGVAYLRCIKSGANESKLPTVLIHYKDMFSD